MNPFPKLTCLLILLVLLSSHISVRYITWLVAGLKPRLSTCWRNVFTSGCPEGIVDPFSCSTFAGSPAAVEQGR